MMIRLTGKTRKGKNRVNTNGAEYDFVESRDKVSFDDEPGPWLLITSIANPKSMRWVHKTDDIDFIIEVI